MDEIKKRLASLGIEWVKETDTSIHVESISDAIDGDLIAELEFFSGKHVVVEKVDFQPTNTTKGKKLPFVSDMDEVLRNGLNYGVSDIHIEKHQLKSLIRFRIDGRLMPFYEIQSSVYQSVINKIKIRAGLDISEKRMPHDGRISFSSGSANVELRVSIIPTIYGEKIVLRYLRNDLDHLSVEKLDLNQEQLRFLKTKLKQRSGLILLSGPTGSGKTTTLYTFLKHLNDDSVNILTIEDPIEYSLQGINQVQLKDEIGLTFPYALRSFLRQDPDVIMVGEIRDIETAQMAIRSSLTGHLVLSTIHTNSTVGIINRLVDMGIPFYQIKTALRMAVSQRLVRLYCPSCKGSGCDECFNTGYKGRQGLFEFMDGSEIHAIKNFEDIQSQNIKFIGGTMQSHVKRLLAEERTSEEELMPIYDEFEN